MRRTATTDDSQAVSLFPFLAVLLSTMGALLLVLVVMARQARLQAAQGELDEASPRVADGDIATGIPIDEMEQLQTAAERLAAVHTVGLKELEESRLRLRHADQHVRQLQDEVAQLYQQVRSLEEMDTHRLEDREQAERELARLRELIQDTEAQLDEQRRRAAAATTSYAIVPYEGPHGTRRRPLYVECRRDAVVLQPEGVELAVRDFQDPLGPGNPLASALRAAEEYYVASSSEASPRDSDEKPYPLVLVRPDGIAAYYHVRRALEGWGSDFGYELLDDDWQLEFPLPNPQVANAQQRAIDLARARQQALALAAPRRFGGSGGLSGAGEGAEGGLFGGLDPALSPDHAGRGTDGRGDGQPPSSAAKDRYALLSSNHGTTAAAPSSPDASAHADASSWSDGVAIDGNRDGNSLGNSATANRSTYEGAPQDKPNSISAPQPSRSSGTRGTDSRTDAGQSFRQSNGASPGNGSLRGTAEAGSTPQASAAGSRMSSGTSATAEDGASFGTSTAIQPLAEVRGTDWALPEARLGAVPVRRTIQVVVRNDRLAVLPEQGATGGRVIPVTHAIQATVDPFVDAIQARVKEWGIAGRGLYWQPILVLKPGPDGVHHAQSLRRLLTGSGLEVAP